jgi:glycogen debranching enzyme
MDPSAMAIVYADYTVLCSAPDGSVDSDRRGLFDYDTRILSRFRLTIDGELPELVGASQPESDTFRARYRIARGDPSAGEGGGRPEGPVLPQDALDLDLERRVGRGMLDRWTITNHSAVAWTGKAMLDIAADFADVAEVGRTRRQEGELRATARERELELRYAARRDDRRFDRAVRVGILGTKVAVTATGQGLGLALDLPPRASVQFLVRTSSRVEGRWRIPRVGKGSASPEGREAWRARRLRIEAPERLRRPFERALEDLYSLRNRDLEHDLLPGATPTAAGRVRSRRPDLPRAWILNAGVPSFTSYFGRDTLTSGWQAALAGTEALSGALEVAAATQAASDDPWRDAEPGKMLHELRRGPLAMLGINPRDAYYGSQTTPAMFVIGLSELWHWTGDDRLLRRYRDAALRATAWAEQSCDPATGFMTYERRSPEGLRNQGWKDSDEAIRHADGRIANPPLATVEEQAFHFLALQRMGEILVALDEPDRAGQFLDRAAALRESWHDAFWMPREGYYALALEGDGTPVRSITSNPGHALGTGIVPPEIARVVADRLLSPALFNGWGVRTLAHDHPSFNPFAYHLGTVWPVENATFALGFKRYGLDHHLERLVEAEVEAAAAFPEARLPEALTGHPREPGVAPMAYPNACSPQAWSASALVQMVQVMLGLYPFAPLRLLTVIRPRLPAWIPEVGLRNVRVGRATVDLRFTRRDDGSASYKVTRRSGSLLVVPAAPPVDVEGRTRSWLELAGTAALERAPGRLVRAARIAVGLE